MRHLYLHWFQTYFLQISSCHPQIISISIQFSKTKIKILIILGQVQTNKQSLNPGSDTSLRHYNKHLVCKIETPEKPHQIKHQKLKNATNYNFIDKDRWEIFDG